jgi:hypothetical protein
MQLVAHQGAVSGNLAGVLRNSGAKPRDYLIFATSICVALARQREGVVLPRFPGVLSLC